MKVAEKSVSEIGQRAKSSIHRVPQLAQAATWRSQSCHVSRWRGIRVRSLVQKAEQGVSHCVNTFPLTVTHTSAHRLRVLYLSNLTPTSFNLKRGQGVCSAAAPSACQRKNLRLSV